MPPKVVKVVKKPKVKPKPTLKLFTLWSGRTAKPFKDLLADFERKTGIEAIHVPQTTDSMKLALRSAFAAGTTPCDVAIHPWPGRIKSDGKGGHLLPVGDIYPTNYAIKPSTYEAEGKVYAIPYKMNLKPGFWYKISFFKENGLSEPETWDEFISLLDKLKKNRRSQSSNSKRRWCRMAS